MSYNGYFYDSHDGLLVQLRFAMSIWIFNKVMLEREGLVVRFVRH